MIAISSKMKKCLENPKLCPIIIQSIVAVLKKDILEIQFTSFPTYLVFGEPGSGKTPLVNSTTIYKEDFNFDMRHGDLVNRLCELKFNAINLDDCADLNSSSGKQRQYNNLDSAIRMGYKGTGALLTVTAETEAIKKLSKSAMMRMIPLSIGNGLKDSSLSELVTFLQNTKELEQFVLDFQDFYRSQSIDFSTKLIKYRKKNPNKGGKLSKRVDMVFCFHIAMELVSEMFLSNGIYLDSEAIEKIETELLSLTIEDFFDSRENLTEKVVEFMIFNNYVKPQVPIVAEYCDSYLLNGCEGYTKYYKCNDYNHCAKCSKFKIGIDPSSIALNLDTNTNAVLIDEPKLLKSFCRVYDVPPFLIIEKNYFDSMMNMSLGALCKLEGRKIMYFNTITLKKDLYSYNRLMIAPNIGKGNRYTHSFVGVDQDGTEQTIRVVLLMLKTEEVEYLKKNLLQEDSDWDRLGRCYDQCGNHSIPVNNHILKYWSQVSFFAGANIGECVERLC